jgi:hypothetical protein
MKKHTGHIWQMTVLKGRGLFHDRFDSILSILYPKIIENKMPPYTAIYSGPSNRASTADASNHVHARCPIHTARVVNTVVDVMITVSSCKASEAFTQL